MKNNCRKLCLSVMLFLAMVPALFAQVTTSGINGKITGNGEVLPGAAVVAIHVPSGTQYGTITNSDGRFTIQGMRTGGPYTVEVSFIGYTKSTLTDITLYLGESYTVNTDLKESTTEVGEVTVVGIKSSSYSQKSGGAVNISRQTMESLPTISRGLKDFTKLSPLANVSGNGTSFAGSNNRYNQFAIDGLVNNDVFGLSNSGTNGGQTGIEPISLDAIEEFQINIAPYDIRQSGFTGGGINAVTKSGTNKFSGSAYYYGNNESLVGKNEPVKHTKSDYPDYKDYLAGFTLGGPIVKNKLFFFVNGEISRSKTPLASIPGTSSSNITVDEINRVLSVLNRIAPNYDPGDYETLNNETNSNKLLFKVNWNINDHHKLVLRHSYTYGENTSISRSANSLRFANNGIYFPSTTNSSGLELNSIFSNNSSNKLLIGYTTVRDNRDPLGSHFPTVLLNIGSGRSITIGSEYSSVANELNQDIITVSDDYSIYRGKHTLTFGTHNEIYRFYNLFVQNIFGSYAYRSLADFETVGTAGEVSPTYYAVGYSFDENDNPLQTKGAAEFTAYQLGLYGQDEFYAHDKLKFTLGLRIDVPLFPETPGSNEAFNTAYAAQDVATGDLPKTRVMWSPRFGFNWDVNGDKSFQIRGGTGLFTGRVPFVWVSNQYSNNGQLNGAYSVGSSSSSGTPITNPAGIKFNADPYDQPLAEDLGKTAGRGAINVIDKDFKFPQVFRSNIAIEKMLPWGIKGTVEAIYSKTLNNINFINLNRQVSNTFTFIGADHRPRYTPASTSTTNRNYNSPARLDANYEEIVKLENTNKGYTYNFVVQLQKNFRNGFDASAAYTFGRSMDLNSGTSSVAYSNWRYVNNVKGLNNLELTRSNYDLGSRVIGYVSYKKEYFKGLMSTQVSLFYNGQSGQPYSYIYKGDLNNDATDNDLIFVPETRDQINLVNYSATVNGGTVTISADDQWDMLNSFIESDDYLKTRRGKYAERNGARLPFSHQFDLKVLQEIKVKTGSLTNRFQVSLDVMNIGNLLNKEWGIQYYTSNQQFSLVEFKGLQDMDPSSSGYRYINAPTFNYTGSGMTNSKPYTPSDFSSRWRAQIGFRYFF